MCRDGKPIDFSPGGGTGDFQKKLQIRSSMIDSQILVKKSGFTIVLHTLIRAMINYSNHNSYQDTG